MANTVVNENIFKPNAEGVQKFVDLKGLDHFWTKAQAYVDTQDAKLSGRITDLEDTVGDSTKGLVKDVNYILDELETISGGVGSVGTQINNAINALDLPNTYEAKGEAAKAEAAAKAYANSLASNYDAAGAAAGAEAAAKAYADNKVTAAVGVYTSEGVEASGLRREIAERDAAVLSEAKSYADGLDAAIKARVDDLEAIDHNQIATQAAAAAVAGVIDGAPEKFDTLKEIAAWIAEADTAEDAASLVTRVASLETDKADKTYVNELDTAIKARVSVLEGIDHDAYKAADTAIASTLRNEITTAKAEAISDAKDYTDEKVGALATTVGTLTETVASNLETAKTYADGVAATAKAEAISDAKDYTDNALKSYTNTTGMEAAIAAAKEAAIAAAQAKIDALTQTVNTKADKNYVDEQVAGAKAYGETYTDLLFESITFANNTEIESIFNN